MRFYNPTIYPNPAMWRFSLCKDNNPWSQHPSFFLISNPNSTSLSRITMRMGSKHGLNFTLGSYFGDYAFLMWSCLKYYQIYVTIYKIYWNLEIILIMVANLEFFMTMAINGSLYSISPYTQEQHEQHNRFCLFNSIFLWNSFFSPIITVIRSMDSVFMQSICNTNPLFLCPQF